MYLSENLQKKWEPVLNHPDLPEIKDPYRRAVTALVLENQQVAMQKENSLQTGSFLREDSPTNYTDTGGFGGGAAAAGGAGTPSSEPRRRAAWHPTAQARRARTGGQKSGTASRSSPRQPRGVLWLRIRLAQIERTRRPLRVARRGADARDPFDVGRGRDLDELRRRFVRGPRRRHHRGAVADEARGAVCGHLRGLAQACDAWRNQRAAAGSEDLEIDMIVPRIDRDGHRDGVVLVDVGRGIGRQRGESDRGLLRRERNAARRRDADARSVPLRRAIIEQARARASSLM